MLEMHWPTQNFENEYETLNSVWSLMQYILHMYYNLYLYKTGIYTKHRGNNLCICKGSILLGDSLHQK